MRTWEATVQLSLSLSISLHYKMSLVRGAYCALSLHSSSMSMAGGGGVVKDVSGGGVPWMRDGLG